MADLTPTPKPVSAFGSGATSGKSAFGTGSATGKSAFGAISKTPATGAKAAKPKQDELPPIASFGKSFIDFISSAGYFNQGMAYKATKDNALSDAEFKKKYGYTRKDAQTNIFNSLNYLGSNIQAGFDNANAWRSGQQVKTTVDVLRLPNSPIKVRPNSPEEFTIALAGDIATDPTTYVPGGVFLRPATAGLSFAKTALKTAKAGAVGDTKLISERLAYKAAPTFEAKKEVISKATTLKPMTDVLNQYTWKPIIKEDLKRTAGEAGTRLAALEKNIKKNFTFKVSPLPEGTNATLGQIIGSSLEAGYKAAASNLVQKYARDDLRKLVRLENKAAKKLKATVPAAVETAVKAMPDNVAPAARDAISILDNEAIKATTEIVKKTKVADVEAKAAKNMITTLEKLSKGVTGLRKDGRNIVQEVSDIMTREHGVAQFANALKPATLGRIKNVISGTADPLRTIRELVNSKNDQMIAVARILIDKKVVGSTGQEISIGDMIRKGIDYNGLSAATKKKIIAHFAYFTTPGDVKLSELNSILDAKTVDAIAKTGALSGGTVKKSALAAIMKNLPTGNETTEKVYENFADLVGGLKAGDTIDFGVISKIMKAIDPEATPLKQTEKALKKETAYEMMRNLIIGDGVQTFYDAQRRLDLADASKLFAADGISLSEIIANYVKNRLDKTTGAFPSALEASRDAAQKNVARWMTSPDKKIQSAFKEVLYAINAGLTGKMGKEGEAGQFAYIREILGQEDALTGTSSFSDTVIKSQASKRAVLPNQINQSVEVRIFSNLAGIVRHHVGKSETKTFADSIDDLILKTNMLDDALLALTGGKIAHQKIFQRGVPLADQPKHYVFNNMGDFLRIFKATGKTDLAYKALIPDTNKAGILKTDTLSTIGIGKAIRHIAEMAERNLPVDRDELISMLKSRGEGQTEWSATYKKRVNEFVGDIADHLVQPEVVAEFRNAHTQRALASVEDALDSAETITNDIYSSLYNGFKTVVEKDTDSVAARQEQARSWFNKFVLASGIFKQQQGDVAEAVFQAAALMFMKKGKLPGGAALVGSATAQSEADRAIWENSMQAIREMYKYSTSDGTAAAGRETAKTPTVDQIAKATNELTAAREVYETVAKDIYKITNDAEAIKAWEKRYLKAQADLNKARTNAMDLSIPVHNYLNGEWIPSANYNRELAIQTLKDSGASVLMTEKGVINLADKMVDDAVTPIKPYKMNAAQRKAYMDAWTAQTAVKNYDHAVGLQEEVAAKVIADEAAYDAMEDLTVFERAQRMFQDSIAKVYEDATIKVIRGATTKAGLKRGAALAEGEIRPGRVGRFAEGSSATAGRWNLRPILTRADTSLMQNISNISDVAHQIRLGYRDLMKTRPEAFAQAYKYAISREEIPADAEPIVAELATNIRKLLEPLFGNPETTVIGASGLHPEAIKAALSKYGLNDTAGFMNAAQMNPKQLSEYAMWMPFADIPPSIIGTAEEAEFVKNAKKFAESGIDPLAMVARLAQAIQFAKTEQAFVLDFATRFSYKAQGLTFEQAMRKGWVKIEGISAGGTDLSKYLPTPEQGGLFPPEIAKEFLSLNREWNAIFQSGKMPRYVATLMNVTGWLKATQTILRLGHHITNAFGDTTTAMIAGTRNPVHWKQGMQLAKMFMADDIKATWGAQRLDAKFDRLFEGYRGYGKAFESKGKDGLGQPAIAINANGKLQKVAISYDDLSRMFKERGIILGNIFHNDIQGLYDSIVAESGKLVGNQKQLNKIIEAKLNQAMQKIEQPAGAFASWYGNVPRAAHAMQVIQSRSWSSIDEALSAAQDAINKYHPTIQSLAAGERKTARLMVTYYTWLRVAHNALIDMAVNHTGAMLIPSKINYNLAKNAGLEPTSPGDMWGDETYAPQYMKYSVYGPTEVGVNGPVVYKRSFLPLDVLDTWNLSYDPTMSTEQNLLATGNQIFRTLGQAANPFIQTGMQLFNPDLAGKTTQIKDSATLQDALLEKTGFYNLAIGLGLYTPPGKQVEQADRDRKIRNWITGQKETFVETSGNLKNYQTEQTNRWKQWFDQQGK